MTQGTTDINVASKRHWLYGFNVGVLVVVALGVFAFVKTPTDLFPNSVPPQVVVITVYPGSDAGDVADKITQVVEKELNTLGGLTKVTSTRAMITKGFFMEKAVRFTSWPPPLALPRAAPSPGTCSRQPGRPPAHP